MVLRLYGHIDLNESSVSSKTLFETLTHHTAAIQLKWVTCSSFIHFCNSQKKKIKKNICTFIPCTRKTCMCTYVNQWNLDSQHFLEPLHLFSMQWPMCLTVTFTHTNKLVHIPACFFCFCFVLSYKKHFDKTAGWWQWQLLA